MRVSTPHGCADSNVCLCLDLVVIDGQPLHVAAMVGATGAQRDNVVDVITRAGESRPIRGRASVLFDESVALDGAAGLFSFGERG